MTVPESMLDQLAHLGHNERRKAASALEACAATFTALAGGTRIASTLATIARVLTGPR